MVRLLADVNFNGDIVRGLRLRNPNIDLIRAQDVPLEGVDDPGVLEWAAANDRIVVTHDKSTLPSHAYKRVDRSEPMPGVFILNDRFPVGRAIEELALIDECTEQIEWQNLVVFLPL
jgi:hypothetical protein